MIDRLDTPHRSRHRGQLRIRLKNPKGWYSSGDKREGVQLYSSLLACPVRGLAFEELQPRTFWFNSPFGACEECHGLGVKMEFDADLIIPDKNRCIADGAVAPTGTRWMVSGASTRLPWQSISVSPLSLQ